MGKKNVEREKTKREKVEKEGGCGFTAMHMR